MPHKLYDCCDSNTCTCGRGDRHGITRDLSEERRKRELRLEILASFSIEELENELKTKKGSETRKKNEELEARLKTLKSVLEDLK
jgi:hypothetical protein